MEKNKIKERENELLDLVRIFCSQKLDKEYLFLCEKLVKKMGRKRDIPFKSGKLEITISIKKNENCKKNFFENYALQTVLQLNISLIVCNMYKCR